jgi:hypothetical protein
MERLSPARDKQKNHTNQASAGNLEEGESLRQ